MSKSIVDQKERDLIKSDLNTNMLVEAGAGSGKTTSLVERMVNLIRTGTCQIDQMVAITFTKKAADELKIRFQTGLETNWLNAEKHEERLRLGEAMENMDQCFLGTIHAFCSRLLRERPIEAGLDLAFSELEEEADNELLEEGWQLFLHTLHEEHPERMYEMSQLAVPIDSLFESVKEMKQYPDVNFYTEEVEKPDLESAYQEWMNSLKEARLSIPEEEPQGGYDVLQKLIRNAIRKNSHLQTYSDKAAVEVFESFNKRLSITQKKWTTKEDAKYYMEKISTYVESMIQPLLLAWKEYCHSKVIKVIQDALSYYEQLKKERSLLNFQDLLMKTAQLLKENAEVRRYFQQKYSCLLVDEFQDTDPIQAEIMFFLTSQSANERDWTKCVPKPGSLFVVGDPKQAIYRFRRADMDTYNRVKALIEVNGGRILHLTMNFRSVNTVTEALNSVFENQFPHEESSYQAAYRPLNAYKESQDEAGPAIGCLTVPANYSNKEQVLEADAEQIARYIADQIQKGARANDLMILTRYTEGNVTYAEKLERLGIPVSVIGNAVIGEMRLFQEMLLLLTTFVDSTDEVAFTATVRGPFFGVSDQDLYDWKEAGGRFSLYSAVPDGVTTATQLKWKGVLDKLVTYDKWTRQHSPTVAIEKILEDVGFYLLLMKHQLGKRAYKALLQLMEQLRLQEQNGNTAFKEAVTLLTNLIHEKTVVANLEGEEDTVRVMNVHQAKGLEAPVVFLAHPKKKVNMKDWISYHIKREGQTSTGYFAFSSKTSSFSSRLLACPPNWEALKQEELTYQLEEEKRIVYVAATRAERQLVISSSAKSNDNNPWQDLLSIEGIEEISARDEVAIAENQPNLLTFSDYQAKLSHRLEWLEESREKTYDTWSPTEDKDYSKVVELDREAGGGLAWGTIIHAIFEKVVKGEPIAHLAKNLLKANGLEETRYQEIEDMVNLFRQSEIWQELQAAQTVLTEVPITFMLDPTDRLYAHIQEGQKSDHSIIVKGVIDLAYKINNAWYIVDYKTDRVKNEAIPLLREFYKSQVEFYRSAWEELTGETVETARLFFCWNSDALQDRIQRV